MHRKPREDGLVLAVDLGGQARYVAVEHQRGLGDEDLGVPRLPPRYVRVPLRPGPGVHEPDPADPREELLEHEREALVGIGPVQELRGHVRIREPTDQIISLQTFKLRLAKFALIARRIQFRQHRVDFSLDGGVRAT